MGVVVITIHFHTSDLSVMTLTLDHLLENKQIDGINDLWKRLGL